MKIKRSPLVFNNVISTTATCNADEWHLTALNLRNAVIKNGLYGTGPIFYQVSNNDQDNRFNYTFYLPVNEQIEMPENDRFNFAEILEYKDGLVLRHADLDDDIEVSYELLREAAKANDLELKEPFYNIYLDVYGGGIIDIYAPIIKVNENDKF